MLKFNAKFLSQADTATESMTKQWKGSLSHIGPVQMSTPLIKSLGGITTCGMVTLMSGVMIWGAARLRPFTDVTYLDELALAAFAWQHDWRYLDSTAGPKGPSPDQPAALSAAMTLRRLFVSSILNSGNWHSFHPPIEKAAHMISVVRFILTKDELKAFNKWLKVSRERLDLIAPLPNLKQRDFNDFENEEAYDLYCSPRRGQPLPPLVLNAEEISTDCDLAVEARKFLQSLDHKTNRYLKNPKDMKALRFVGKPY